MPAPYAPNQMQQLLPALYLYPLNDSFLPKHIHLPQGPRVKIGRQTNVKTAPGERNGFFDSKVLSRQHAEVWEEGGKIFIKDVKSSNGTFINGERLSPEGAESDPFELKTDDIVEFGIDIVGEDNKTIIHHKVAARVVCVFSEQDAQAAARAEQHQNPPLPSLSQPNGGGGGAFNFAGSQGPGGPGQSQRRPPMQQQALAGMGGMGGNMRAPGKSGLTFDHILNRLQGELQKTRETGAELHSLTGAMTDIHETLGGNLPSLPPYPQSLPPVMPPQPPAPQNGDSHPNGINNASASSSSTALAELQAQLSETQMSLATHVDKIRSLEGMLAEHEAIKREVSTLREMMEDEKRELEIVRGRRRSNTVRATEGDGEHEGEFIGGGAHHHEDDDDARSIATVTPHELERVEEEDEEQLAAEQEEEERRRQQREGDESMTRPRTPEPTGMGMRMDEYHDGRGSRSPSPPRHGMSSARENELSDRLEHLSTQLESALELSRALQASHAAAQTTISLLESKVTSLESLVQASQTQVAQVSASMAETREEERKSLTEMVKEWKKGVEGQWSSVREEWREERERLSKAREEWERRVTGVEDGVTRVGDKVEKAVVALAQQQQQQHGMQNGNANVGLVTPPSPRSLSSDSGKQRSRRKRSTASRGRPRSNSASSKNHKDAEGSVDGEGYTSSSEGATLLNDNVDEKGSSIHHRLQGVRTRSPWAHDDSDDEESERRYGGKGTEKEKGMVGVGAGKYPITPDSSVRKSSTGSATTMGTEEDGGQIPLSGKRDVIPAESLSSKHVAQYSTAVTVVVLSVAAAAVLWRVKQE